MIVCVMCERIHYWILILNWKKGFYYNIIYDIFHVYKGFKFLYHFFVCLIDMSRFTLIETALYEGAFCKRNLQILFCYRFEKKI